MSMPFSRPGAIDLSALKHKSSPASPSASTDNYVVEVDQANFQGLLEQSMSAPVMLVMYAPTRSAGTANLADDLATAINEQQGRFLLGRINIEEQTEIATAMQVSSVRLVALVMQGRLQPLFQDAPSLEELRMLLGQLAQQMVSQGLSERHQPVGTALPAVPADDEPEVDPRFLPAEEALMAGDAETAIREYEALLRAQPGDAEAAVGLARAKLLHRTADADLQAARAAAAANPDGLAEQVLVADLDLLGGHVDDAFNRLIELVRRSDGEVRTQAREHLIELFVVVGDDPRVLTARRNLASALY